MNPVQPIPMRSNNASLEQAKAHLKRYTANPEGVKLISQLLDKVIEATRGAYTIWYRDSVVGINTPTERPIKQGNYSQPTAAGSVINASTPQERQSVHFDAFVDNDGGMITFMLDVAQTPKKAPDSPNASSQNSSQRESPSPDKSSSLTSND